MVFTIDEQFYALYLFAVERVARATEVMPLPQSPEIIMGIINIQGKVMPVVNIRKRFHLSEQEINLDNHLIIARTNKRSVVLVVDRVVGISEYATSQLVEAEKILPALDYIDGIAKLANNMILIHDLNKFLSLDEENALDKAIA